VSGLVEGKVALVTGAGTGIGRASALAFAREGASVVVVDVDTEGGEETVRLIGEQGGTAAFVACNVTAAAEVEAVVRRTVELYGRLDCAHNNAGITAGFARTAEVAEADFDRTIAVNLKGVWLCLKYEIAQMLTQEKRGAIVNTASVSGLVGSPNTSAYTASKHGVVGLTKTAGLEYLRDEIRVNAVCPGMTRTSMVEALSPEDLKVFEARQPVGRLADPNEIAEAVVWLCSDRASFVSAVAFPVDAGASAD
jgi:NAD(P)-dependent dehydrogenase (short-subunit alcohol dehydrogenase family)